MVLLGNFFCWKSYYIRKSRRKKAGFALRFPYAFPGVRHSVLLASPWWGNQQPEPPEAAIPRPGIGH